MPHVYTPHNRFKPPRDPAKCAKAVHNGGRESGFHQCTRKGRVEEEGYRWCKQHAPSTERARLKKIDARAARERARINAKFAVRRAEKAVVEAAIEWHHSWHNYKSALHAAVRKLLDARAKLAKATEDK